MQKIKEKTLTPNLSKVARLLDVAGDNARIRILCVLFDFKKVCVSDMADSLQMSVASVSHHLQILNENDLVKTERNGKRVCYTLLENQFTKDLKRLICNGEKDGKKS